MSENNWQNDLSNSAKTFDRVVWPEVEKVLHDNVEHVKAVTQNRFKQCLNKYSGIDAWHILENESVIRGIASHIRERHRVDTKLSPCNSFTKDRHFSKLKSSVL